jgi:hypothetical protein
MLQISELSPERAVFLWFALRVATQKAARAGDRIAEKSILERFYALARTCFEEKC